MFGEGEGQLGEGVTGIAVDQTTGHVYVANNRYITEADAPVIQIFSADGTQLIGSFGKASVGFRESIEEAPESIRPQAPGSLALDGSGDVYVVDSSRGRAESRIMVFRPRSPGDYEHYEYAGRAADIASSTGGVRYSPSHLSVDDAGNLYMVSRAAEIYEFAPVEPDKPACRSQASNLHNLCRNQRKNRAYVNSKGHNGRREVLKPLVRALGCKKAHKKRHKRHRQKRSR